jgi:hypothetical protein
MSQFWLSTSTPENATKLAYTTRNQIDNFIFSVGFPRLKSERIFLEYGKKYYFEVLKVLNAASNDVNYVATKLDWMLPDTNYFTQIDGRYVSNYFDVSSSSYNNSSWEVHGDSLSSSLVFSDSEDEAIAPNFPANFPLQKSSEEHSKSQKDIFGKQFDNNNGVYNKKNIGDLPYIERHYLDTAFPKCKYEPSYTRKRDYKRYEGVFYPYFPEVFPNDGSKHVRFPIKRAKLVQYYEGNFNISEAEVVAVVTTFMETLDKKFPG